MKKILKIIIGLILGIIFLFLFIRIIFCENETKSFSIKENQEVEFIAKIKNGRQQKKDRQTINF